MTVVAVGAIFLVPVLNDCRSRGEGLLECLRQEAADIVPGGSSPADDPSDQVISGTGGSAPERLPLGGNPPQVDRLDVAPDGTVTIVGRGAPGGGVSIYANGELYGTATATPEGAWSLKPDRPLSSGGTAIFASDADGEAVAERAFVVVIDPARQADPKVIESAPEQLAALLLDVAPPLTELPPGGADTAPADDVGDAPAGQDTGVQIVGQADTGAVEPQPTHPVSEDTTETGLSAAERAAREVREALARPRVVRPVPAAAAEAEPAVDGPDVGVTVAGPSAAERAAEEVREALASPHDVLPVPESAPSTPDPGIEPSQPGVSAAERAAQEARMALAAPVEVPPVPVTEAAPSLPDAATTESAPSAAERAAAEARTALATPHDVPPVPVRQDVEEPAPVEGAGVLSVEDRATEEVGQALAAPLEVLPVPVAEGTVADDLLPPAPPVPSARDRAAQEVADALANPHEVAPVMIEATPPESGTDETARDRGRDEAEQAVADAVVAPVTDGVSDGRPQTDDADEQSAPPNVPVEDRARQEADRALTESGPDTGDATEPKLPSDASSAEVESAPTLDLSPVERARLEVRRALELAADEAAQGKPEVADAQAEPAVGSPPADDAAGPAEGERNHALEAIEKAIGVTPDEARLAEPAPETTPDPEETRPARPPVKVAIQLQVPASSEVAPQLEPESTTPSEVAGEPPAPRPRPAGQNDVEVRGTAPEVLAMRIDPTELARATPGRYVVRRGDTLWDIARRVYGHGHKYRTIFQANRHILTRPGRIKPGQVLEIPLVYD